MNKYPLIIISVILYGCWNFLQKLAVDRIHPLHILIVNCCVAICLLPIYLIIAANKITQPFNISGALWGAAAFLCAVGASFAFALSLKQGEAGTVSVLASTSPIITCILAAIFLHESITLNKVIGVVLVIGGVLILGR